MNACGFTMFNGTVCGQPAPSAVTVGCIHEHIETWPTRAYHLDRIEAGVGACNACWHNTKPHYCLTLGRVTA